MLPTYWHIAYSASFPLERLARSVEEFVEQTEQLDRINEAIKASIRERYPEEAERVPDWRVADIGRHYRDTLLHLG